MLKNFYECGNGVKFQIMFDKKKKVNLQLY